MSHRERVGCLVADLSERGVNPFTTAPPLWRLAWTLGLRLAPPHFMGSRTLAVVSGVGIGLLGFLILWYGSGGERPWATALWAAIMGTVIGYQLAMYYRNEAERLHLPKSWAEYPEA